MFQLILLKIIFFFIHSTELIHLSGHVWQDFLVYVYLRNLNRINLFSLFKYLSLRKDMILMKFFLNKCNIKNFNCKLLNCFMLY